MRTYGSFVQSRPPSSSPEESCSWSSSPGLTKEGFGCSKVSSMSFAIRTDGEQRTSVSGVAVREYEDGAAMLHRLGPPRWLHLITVTYTLLICRSNETL